MLHSILFLLLSSLLLSSPSLASSVLSRGLGFQTFCFGNCSFDVVTPTTPGIMMMGGGEDVDEGFKWMIKRSGGGDFVVLRTSGGDAYNEYIFGLGKVNKVTTILITDRIGASSPEVVEIVRAAEAIFMAGGDQSSYLAFWKDNPLHDALDYLVLEKNVTIGGTSAGLHVLGHYIYTGEKGSAVSSTVLKNPYHPYVTLDVDFLKVPYLENVLTDSHFVERDRMGRTITFLARIIADGLGKPGFVSAISIDEATCLLVDQNGQSSALGQNFVYFLRATEAPEVCEPGTSLTFKGVSAYKINESTFRGTFDLSRWVGSGGGQYSISAIKGALNSTQAGGQVY